MSGEFWNREEFDEEKHLTAREVWETVGKYFINHFDDVMQDIEENAAEKMMRLNEDIKGHKAAEEFGGEPASKEQRQTWKTKSEAIKKELDLIKEYHEVRLEEQEAAALRQKEFNRFLEARRRLLALEQEIIKAQRSYFIEKSLDVFALLKDGGLKQVKTEETYREYSQGILPVKPGLRKEKEVPPDFVRSKDMSDLCVNIIDEGFFKLLKQEREIIDDRLCGSKKERPY